MNDIRYKSKAWSAKRYEPTMCKVSYWGCENVDSTSTAYSKWRDMLHRCYNEKIYDKYPEYKGCTVSDEWKNFSNFRCWHERSNYGDSSLNLDKDILYKGNKKYGPENCCLVPGFINTLFTNGKANRGKLPLGVYKEQYIKDTAKRYKDKIPYSVYEAMMNWKI